MEKQIILEENKIKYIVPCFSVETMSFTEGGSKKGLFKESVNVISCDLPFIECRFTAVPIKAKYELDIHGYNFEN